MSAASKERCEQCQLSANKDVNTITCLQTKTRTVSAASKQRREQCQLSASKDLSSVSCQQTKTGTVSVVSKQRREQCQQPANKDGNSVSSQQTKTGTVSAASKQRREQCQCGLEIREQGGHYIHPPSHTNSTNKDVNSLRLYKYLDEVLDVQIYRFPPYPPPPPPPHTHTHTHRIRCQQRHGYSVSRIDKYQDEVVAVQL